MEVFHRQILMVHGKSQPYFFFQISIQVIFNHLVLHFTPSTLSQQADYLMQTAKKYYYLKVFSK